MGSTIPVSYTHLYLLERFEKIMKLEKKEDLLPEPQVRHRKEMYPAKKGRIL